MTPQFRADALPRVYGRLRLGGAHSVQQLATSPYQANK